MTSVLNRDKYVSRLVSPNGTRYWRLKRVDNATAARFPLKYRRLAFLESAALATKELMKDKQLRLAEAWKLLQQMARG